MRLLLMFAALIAAAPAYAARAKDVASFHGTRDNQITGAGLVVGLQRSGDSVRNKAHIRQLGNRLEGLGISVSDDDILARNVAMVMVTATLPMDARTGGRIDVTVASTGDARSLEGGYLLMTPLMGPDGQVYAVAEGPVNVGGFTVLAGGDASSKNTTNTGRVEGGALVEREVASALDFNTLESVEYVLHDPDFTTASRLADSINASFGGEIAVARTSSTVVLAIPAEFAGRFPSFAARVEAVQIDVDSPARVVISERTGTVVMGADVEVSAVAVAHGGLTIDVRRTPVISQPGPFSGGATVADGYSEIEVDERAGKLVMVEGVTIGEIVSGLNAMGVTPRDLIIILQAIQAAGALNAEIVSL